MAGFNDDNDSPGVRLSATGLVVGESSPGTSFSVSLYTQPTADVTIHFTSLNTGQITVDPATATLTFDAGNWDYYQYVNLVPVDDPYDDVNEYEPWTVQSSNAVSADPNYSGLDVNDHVRRMPRSHGSRASSASSSPSSSSQPSTLPRRRSSDSSE